MKISNFDSRLKDACATKNSLFVARQDAVDAYAAAVAELAHNIGAASRVQYGILRRAAQVAHQRSIDSAADLAKHIREHGCDDAA